MNHPAASYGVSARSYSMNAARTQPVGRRRKLKPRVWVRVEKVCPLTPALSLGEREQYMKTLN